MIQETMEKPGGSPHDAGGRWHYALLFGVQTVGAVLFFGNAIPHYRRILADPASFEARPETLLWALPAIAVMQIGFWIRFRVHPSMPRFTNALLSYIVLFVGRMGFVLATSLFGFVFITQKPGFHMPMARYALFVVGLFAIFCYTQELERLGKALSGPEKKPGE